MTEGRQEMTKFQTHFKRLLMEKGLKEGNPISQRQVAKDTDLSIPAIGRWYQSKVDRLEADTVGRLLKYFECSLADLVEVIEDEQ